MVSSAGQLTASRVIAARYLCLAAESENSGDVRLARDCYLDAVRHDPTPEAGITFGRFLAESGQVEDAILVLQDAWQLAKRRAHPDEIALCCRQIALLFHRASNPSLAKRFAGRAAAAEMSAWRDHEAAFSCDQLLLESQICAADGDGIRARQLCNAAREVASDLQRSSVLRHLARLSEQEGLRREAARLLVSAARAARRAQQQADYAECLLELGHALRAIGRGKLAVDAYRAAARSLQKAGRLHRAIIARRWCQETAAIERMSAGNPDWN